MDQRNTRSARYWAGSVPTKMRTGGLDMGMPFLCASNTMRSRGGAGRSGGSGKFLPGGSLPGEATGRRSGAVVSVIEMLPAG